ncbi:DUF3592 domain-containing protein [Xenorhabdus sp. PB61.4]|uniref:DUF3592 domain-containing protein n=1 Tax=Xenorhabdus sp. PB61.4 TaxID=2788940 RepID=UPI001E4A9BFD|nr:DUF3592 domain-containing protein [Xenorhabdus sp. PB61.4]MCC8366159.1 DUF3592 domain-containing protein [Xenorhabdus sp. PB61.4]
METKYKILLGLVAFVGVLFLFGAFHSAKSTVVLMLDGVKTTGVVTKLELHISNSNKSKGKKESKYYHPVINFTTEEGKEVQFTSSSGSNPASYNIGEKLEIIYLKDNPANAQLNNFSSLYGIALIFSLFGFLFSLIGFFPLFRARKSKTVKLSKRSKIVS